MSFVMYIFWLFNVPIYTHTATFGFFNNIFLNPSRSSREFTSIMSVIVGIVCSLCIPRSLANGIGYMYTLYYHICDIRY